MFNRQTLALVVKDKIQMLPLAQINYAIENGFINADTLFFNNLVALNEPDSFQTYLAPLHRTKWVVYAKQPFAGPEQVLAYLARYTHRVAIGNGRIVGLDDTHVSFRWKDYRDSGHHRSKIMRLEAGEFMRRFLLHVLPDGLHRIRHYGLFANGHRAEKSVLCRKLLAVPAPSKSAEEARIDGALGTNDDLPPCPCCGGRMKIIEIFERGASPRTSLSPAIAIDTS